MINPYWPRKMKEEQKNMTYLQMNRQELEKEREKLEKEYSRIEQKHLRLDMSRGKPSPQQLDLSNPMLDCIDSKSDFRDKAGFDLRNYGILDGFAEIRELMGSLIGAAPEQVIVGGSSSLNMMYDAICRGFTHGMLGGNGPWCKEKNLKFLCPVPGYDRHFAITEFFGFEMIPVDMTPQGPDMDQVEKLVSSDPAIKGIWCVPKYSNPQGYCYSDDTVRRMARLKPAAGDFRIFWDNAYCVHHLTEEETPILNILEECEKAGNPNLVLEFASTSKLTFPGAGVAILAASKENVSWIKKQLSFQTIGCDKLNMLRHLRFFRDLDGVRAHMKRHAALLKPKFDLVVNTLHQNLDGVGIGSWTEPKGGYFITFTTPEGCAARTVDLCKQAGVVLTEAGATHPLHHDPKDNTIRLAPSYPSLQELAQAMEVFCICVRLAAVEQLLG